jgi:biopolymer transport protein ExbD
MKVYRPPQRKVRIEMVPIIDIVFLLLVFFIYAMLSMAVHRALPVRLPTSTTAKVNKELILSVTVKADGRVFVNKEEVSGESLVDTLRRKSEGKPEAGVLLFADRALSYQRLFMVLDQIRTAGLTRISLQARAGNEY